MTALLNPKAAERLVKLCGLLGSTHDGERAAAGKLADEFIKQLGLNWSDVIVQPPAEWQHMAAVCGRRWPELSERERDFLTNIQRLRKPPSDRQLEWLQSIFDRLQAAERQQ